MSKVIEIKNLDKIYDLGLVGTGSLAKDLNRSWAKFRGKPDPYATLAEINDRTEKSESNMVYAIKDVNFSVEQGEVLGIIGKNGAGKSTLLKILSQITSPSKGSIKMRGRVASLLEVGTGMHPEMTARENIYLNGSLMGMRNLEITNKLEEIVAFAGIEKYLDTPVKRFSSGMTVRLGFAVAAFLEPEILIVDEVLAVGDAEFQKKAIGKMQDVTSGGGRTVLFVSHNMAAISNLCSRVIVLDKGGVYFNGETELGINEYLMQQEKRVEKVNLLERNDREGSKELIFSKIELFNKFDQNVNVVKSGDDIYFKVYFKLSDKYNPSTNDFIFRLQITDVNGDVVATLNNFHSSQPFSNLNNDFVICKVKRIPFFDGCYDINLQCLLNRVCSDYIENAFPFNIETGDFYNTGKTPGVKKGILLDHKWEN